MEEYPMMDILPDPSSEGYLDFWSRSPSTKRLSLWDQIKLRFMTVITPSAISGGNPTLMANGVDYSHWQGDVDIDRQHKEGGISFAFVKASDGKRVREGDPTQPKYYVDDWLYRNVQKCYDTKIACGPYHYVQPYLSPDYTVKGTIDWNWTVMKYAMDPLVPKKSYHMYALDVEEKTAADYNGSDVVLGLIDRTMNDPKLSQVPLVIYSSMSVLNWYTKLREQISFPGESRTNLWSAQWIFTKTESITWQHLLTVIIPSIEMRVLTPGYKSWKFLQYAACYTLPGCSGRVDLNKYNGTEAGLYGWLGFTGDTSGSGGGGGEDPELPQDPELAKQVAQNTADIALLKAWQEKMKQANQ